MHTIYFKNENTGETHKISGLGSLPDAKAKIIEYQMVPNSLYRNLENTKRTDKHFLYIEDDMGNMVYGENRDVKATTLSYTVVKNDTIEIDLPNTHIELYIGGKESRKDIEEAENITLDDSDIVLFHIDKREMDTMLKTLFHTDLGYQYSKLRSNKLNAIIESPFYSSFRDGLESDINAEISGSLLFNLGSEYTDDVIFETTEKGFLPLFIYKYHHEHSEKFKKFKVPDYKTIQDFTKIMNNIDDNSASILGDPPAFYTENWEKSMLLKAREIIYDVKSISPVMNVNPIIYSETETIAPLGDVEILSHHENIEQNKEGGNINI